MAVGVPSIVANGSLESLIEQRNKVNPRKLLSVDNVHVHDARQIAEAAMELVRAERAEWEICGEKENGRAEEKSDRDQILEQEDFPKDSTVDEILFYQKILSEIILDVTMVLHKHAKTDPERIYEVNFDERISPEGRPCDVKAKLERRCTEAEQMNFGGKKALTGIDAAEAAPTTTKTPATAVPQNKRKLVDLYGNQPMKSPGHTVCEICHRQIAVIKFSSHLERCLQIGGRAGSRSSSKGSR